LRGFVGDFIFNSRLEAFGRFMPALSAAGLCAVGGFLQHCTIVLREAPIADGVACAAAFIFSELEVKSFHSVQ